jgi:hypothetical protein
MTMLDVNDFLVKTLARLIESTSSSRRAEIADEISDIIESWSWKGGAIGHDIVEEIVRQLITLGLNDRDALARESLLHALVEAAALGLESGWRIELGPLADSVDGLNEQELEYALYALGFSGDAEYLAVIQPFLDHRSENIRNVARQAERVLQEKRPPGNGYPRIYA